MKNKENINGFTLVEALIAMAILSFIIVTILSGFTHQKMATRKIADKNLALSLAEIKMQELQKFSAGQLTAGITTDWIIHRKGLFKVYQSDPNDVDQFRRVTFISVEQGNVLGDKMVIQVMVEYGKEKNTYPFRVVLSTKKGI